MRFPAVALAAMTALSASAQAADVRALRLLDGEDHTRAVLEFDGQADYRLFALDNPHRLVLDLKGSRLAGGFRAPAPNGIIAGVRTGKPAEGDLRVVFDLVGGVSPKTYLQTEGGRRQLVLELRANGGRAARPAPARTMADVIGREQRDLVIAIDAGHGGKDPGARGPSGSREKNITLAVARELARQIDAESGLEAVLIRDSDVFLPLQTRYMKARQAKADLFVSIHADAFHKPTASGSSVFVLSRRGASSQAARWLADRENAADLVGGVRLGDKDGVLASVLLDLSQSATMKASDDAADHVLRAMKRLGKTHKSRIEYANFVVLRSPDVPSMLVETAFITNPGEEQRLNDPGHRQRLATAILGGVRDYFTAQPPPGTWYAARAEARQTIAGISREHVVVRGDTLTSIAGRHGVSMVSLRAANRISGDTVRLGQRLRIPAVGQTLPAGGALVGTASLPR